jgi:auxin efflux carrier family protein
VKLPKKVQAFLGFIDGFLNAPLIGAVYLIAGRTNLLNRDPILWFVMMMMPTGPPATKLVALTDVSGADEDEKMSIAKVLTISYAISPLICLAVVGSLKASSAISV